MTATDLICEASVSEIRELVATNGGEFLGIQCGPRGSLVMFLDLVTRTTLAIPQPDFSAVTLSCRIHQSRESYRLSALRRSLETSLKTLRLNSVAWVLNIMDMALRIGELARFVDGPSCLEKMKKAYGEAVRFSARALSTPDDYRAFQFRSVRIEKMIAEAEATLPLEYRERAQGHSGEYLWNTDVYPDNLTNA